MHGTHRRTGGGKMHADVGELVVVGEIYRRVHRQCHPVLLIVLCNALETQGGRCAPSGTLPAQCVSTF